MTSVATLTWSIDPNLLALGPLRIRWYGLLFASAFVLGYHIFRWMCRREGKPQADLDSLLIVVLAGTLIGARLGHCLIYEPAYYFNHPTEFIKIWHGGLASHGGALGILVALGLYCRRHRDLGYLWILDRLTVPAALGGAFIRLGNFFNSEIIGRPTDLPWGVVFTRVDGLARHPVQLYESAAYAAVFLVLLTVYLKARKPREGLLIGLFLTAVFSARFLLEFAKERQAPYGESLVLSVGQMLSLPMVALGLALIVWSVRRPVRPVTVSGQR